MSELLCCDKCGELLIYDSSAFINNKPLCPECLKKSAYILQSANNE